MKKGKFIDIAKRERKQQGMSKEKLAARMGVTSRAISYWETGYREMSLSSAIKMAKELNMDIKLIELKE